MTARIPASALAVLLLICLAPAAQAVEFGFGSPVGSSDYDISPIPEVVNTALCFVDTNGDGLPFADEPILMLFKVPVAGNCDAPGGNSLAAITATTTAAGAVLLNTIGGLAPGTEIKRSDDLGGAALTNLTGLHLIRFYEEGTDTGKLDARDSVYVDLTGLGSLAVSAGDLRITPVGPHKGGTIVQANDLDESRALREMTKGATGFGTIANNPVYKAGSAYYINADGDTVGKASFKNTDSGCSSAAITSGTFTCTFSMKDLGVESGDIRLNAKAVNPLSDAAVVLPDHIEVVQPTVVAGQTFQVKVTAKNTGKVAGAGLIETKLDDVLVDGRGTNSIDPNAVGTVTITLVAPTTPGLHTVKAGVYTDFLTVVAPAAPVVETAVEESPVAATSNGAPGLGTVAFVGVLLGLVLWTRRA